MLEEVFGASSYRDQDFGNTLSYARKNHTSSLVSLLKQKTKLSNRQRCMVLIKAMIASRRDITIRKARAFSKWKQNSYKHELIRIIQESHMQDQELKKIKQAHVATIQAFVNSKTELEGKLVKMAALIQQKIM